LYEIKNLEAGVYDLEISYVGYQTSTEEITISRENTDLQDNIHELEQGFLLDECLIIAYDPPRITGCTWTCGHTVTNCFTYEEEDKERPVFRKKQTKNLRKRLAKVYPNPTTDYLRFETNENLQYISLSNIAGKQLALVRNTSSLSSLPVSNLMSGTYILTFFYEDGSSTTEKFMKHNY